MRPSKELFPENVNRLLAELGITASEFASRIGADPSSVCKWRSGLQHPEFRFYDPIAKALKAPVSKLFEDTRSNLTRASSRRKSRLT